MTVVTPIEPHLRRRDANRLPAAGRPAEGDRGAPIPVFREPAAPTRAVVDARRVLTQGAALDTTVAAEPALTDAALAARFFPLAALVVVADLVTKAWAASALATSAVTVSRFVSLSLVYNPGAAGGVTVGDHTRAVSFAATGVVVGLLVMIAPSLTRFDRRAWVALALLAGAGFGNLVGLLTDARGVVDFIALHGGDGGALVLNVADLALVVGLVLLGRTVLRLARAVRAGVVAV